MSLTARYSPLATAGLAFVLATAPVGMAYEPPSMTYDLDSYVTEEIIAQTLHVEKDAEFAEDMAAWERLSDEALTMCDSDGE